MSTDTKDVIADGKVVLFNYTLTDPSGAILDASEGQPMPYLHGAENIVPGLERAMTGRSAGDSFEVVVAPEDGYGLRTSGGPRPVDRAAFPEDAEVEAGMMFHSQTDDGSFRPLWVTSVEADQVFVDFDHPLAGVPLRFGIDVVAIREATPAELEHGHPHGPDGHGHHH